jgi:hypothetical protein
MEKGSIYNETSAQVGSVNAYAIQSIPGKGQGLIATSKIPKGTRILSEAPIFKVSYNVPDFKIINNFIIKELKRLNKTHQRAFFSLHNAYGRDNSPFLGIARTNALPLGCGAGEGGIFLEASRINHSCRNNSQNTWNENIGRLTIHALRDIEEGQEITISYLGSMMEYAERQRSLKRSFFFDCRCELCSIPVARRKESDVRLKKIQLIDDALGYLNDAMSDYKGGLHLVHTIFRLFKEEGQWDASVPRAYYDAFQIAIANGDETRARIFAERAYAARVVVEGDDSPEAVRLAQLVDKPTQHRLYGLFVDNPEEVEIPQGLDESTFEDWL